MSHTADPPYDDEITKKFVWATVAFALVGMTVGAWIALELAFWPANMGVPYLTFGRLRPLHTNAVVFAFGGNIVFAGMYYSMQRLLKVRMWSDAISATSTSGVGRPSSSPPRSRCRSG